MGHGTSMACGDPLCKNRLAHFRHAATCAVSAAGLQDRVSPERSAFHRHRYHACAPNPQSPATRPAAAAALPRSTVRDAAGSRAPASRRNLSPGRTRTFCRIAWVPPLRCGRTIQIIRGVANACPQACKLCLSVEIVIMS